MVTRLRAGLSGTRILTGASDLSLLRNAQARSGAHPVSYSVGTGAVYGGGVKQLRGEVNHSPSCSAEVMNEWGYTSTHLCSFMA
jgi:hypothetical protein